MALKLKWKTSLILALPIFAVLAALALHSGRLAGPTSLMLFSAVVASLMTALITVVIGHDLKSGKTRVGSRRYGYPRIYSRAGSPLAYWSSLALLGTMAAGIVCGFISYFYGDLAQLKFVIYAAFELFMLCACLQGIGECLSDENEKTLKIDRRTHKWLCSLGAMAMGIAFVVTLLAFKAWLA